MELLIWLVGLAGSIILCRMTAGARSLSWEPAGSGGVRVGRSGKNPDKPDLIGFGIAVPPGIEFDLRRETALDRWFYRLGVGRDTAIGNDVDGIVHFACTSPSLVAALRADASLRALLRQLVFAIDSAGFKNLGATCRDGQLELLFRRAGDADPGRLRRTVAPRLEALRQALPATTVSERLMGLPPDGGNAAWMVAICHGLLLNAVLQWARLFFMGPPFVLERGAMFVTGMVVAVLMLIALLYLALRWLGASPRLTTVLFALMSSGAIGCLLSGPTLARDVNIAFDFSEPARISMSVTQHKGRRGRVSSTYSVGRYGRFRVSGRAPDFFVLGDRRDGALGIAWVGNIRSLSMRELVRGPDGRELTDAEFAARMRELSREEKARDRD